MINDRILKGIHLTIKYIFLKKILELYNNNNHTCSTKQIKVK